MKEDSIRHMSLARLARTRDLSVPDWGPYSKIMAGVSHLVRSHRISVDFLFAMRTAGRDALLPFFEGRHRDFHFHAAEPGLRGFSYQFDLDGTDKLCAIARFRPRDGGCMSELELINRTSEDRAVDLEIMAIIPPELKRPPAVDLRGDEVWVGAEAYRDLATWPRRSDDGYRNLVRSDPDAVGGVVVARCWSLMPGTRISYSVSLERALAGGWLGIRYHLDDDAPLKYFVDWDGRAVEVQFEKGGYRWLWVQLGDVCAGRHEFSISVDPASRITGRRNLYGQVPGDIRLDGFFVGPAPRAEAVRAQDPGCMQVVRRTTGSRPGTFAFSWDQNPAAYAIGLPPGTGSTEIPQLFEGAEFMRHAGAAVRLGCWGVPSVNVPANGTLKLVVEFADGIDMPAALEALGGSAATAPVLQSAAGSHVNERFETGFRTMAASCLMNVSYPVFLPWEVIASYTPGKTFGGLYSWDAGMHGLGLLEVDPDAAVECLNVYLCGKDDPVDFIWHGTPLPVQVYLLAEILQRTGDSELLQYFYPRARRFYLYLAGHTPGSPANRFGNGLLNTYPLFYNTGGWDDLPPQIAVHVRGLEDEITPVSATAHTVRFARFMARFAARLGHAADLEGYQADIVRGLRAVERTWDESAGVYSYVRHSTFQPFRSDCGANFNHTLDAMTPLIGGGISAARAEVLWGQIRSPERYWSPVGLSTVDMKAPYYESDGYWNGCVWIPHQWFLWKAALDWGQVDLALGIPRRVADVWEREVRRTRCTFEYVRISTGEGDGYPHFAGLSSPVLAMISAISRLGLVTVGFDSEIRQVQLDGNRLSFEVRTDNPGQSAVGLAVMPQPGRYAAKWPEGKMVYTTDELGALVFQLPSSRNWTGVCLEQV